jgi:hypothetical protein
VLWLVAAGDLAHGLAVLVTAANRLALSSRVATPTSHGGRQAADHVGPDAPNRRFVGAAGADDLDPDVVEAGGALGYLLDVYKLYQGHINTMFNYFLLGSGLFANALIQIWRKEPLLSAYVADFAGFMSIISLCLQIRSRELL